MILSGQTIEHLGIIKPFAPRSKIDGMSYGLGPASYDVRIDQVVVLSPGDFILASTMEEFRMPDNVLGQVADKSTWARRGLSLFNTIIDPGWRGFLTLELTNHGDHRIIIERGWPICQVVFSFLDAEARFPYSGKYMNQGPEPVGPLMEN